MIRAVRIFDLQTYTFRNSEFTERIEFKRSSFPINVLVMKVSSACWRKKNN